MFRNLGLDDATIRNWFNGPAFLCVGASLWRSSRRPRLNPAAPPPASRRTWSRGQNEYGNCIAGPLPRSWMQSQWDLQRQILTRYRSLGIVSQLPGFQGNVPWALAALKGDSNITQQGDTGWMYSTDPLFATIADAWMAQLCNDFNCTDHWCVRSLQRRRRPSSARTPAPPCTGTSWTATSMGVRVFGEVEGGL